MCGIELLFFMGILYIIGKGGIWGVILLIIAIWALISYVDNNWILLPKKIKKRGKTYATSNFGIYPPGIRHHTHSLSLGRTTQQKPTPVTCFFNTNRISNRYCNE